jgi:DNA repair protein SbcD/Mre11
MLRILHTADWHLGQTLRGYSRDYEHETVLTALIEIVQEKQIDVLLIAGDIFDSQHPSGESQALFYRTLARLYKARPQMQVVIIAGNHDSAGRLEAPHPLLESFNVSIIGNVRRADGRINSSRHLRTLANENGESFLHVLALSYPTAACLPPISSADTEKEESNIIRSVRTLYDELHSELLPRLSGLPFIVMGHLHVRGAVTSEGAERKILIGGQHAVPVNIFPEDAAYVALGHLHKAQFIDSKRAVRYSGSLIPLSSTEQPYQHGVSFITINGNTIACEHIEIARPVDFLSIGSEGEGIRLSEVSDHLGQLNLPADMEQRLRPFVQIRLSRQGLGSGFREQIESIASSFPIRIVDARPDPISEAIQVQAASSGVSISLAQISPEEMFQKAFRQKVKAEPTEAQLKIFHNAYAEAQE